MGEQVEKTTKAKTNKIVKRSTDKAFVLQDNLDIELKTKVGNLK